MVVKWQTTLPEANKTVLLIYNKIRGGRRGNEGDFMTEAYYDGIDAWYDYTNRLLCYVNPTSSRQNKAIAWTEINPLITDLDV
jgi:hypothetical protein